MSHRVCDRSTGIDASNDTEEHAKLAFGGSLLYRQRYYGLSKDKLPSLLKYCSWSVSCLFVCSVGHFDEIIADFCFYVANHHSLFSLALGCPANKFTPMKKRVQFFGVQGLAFILYCAGANIEGASKYLYNYLGVLPSIVLISELTYSLLVCPCFQKSSRDGCLFQISCSSIWVVRMFYKRVGSLLATYLCLGLGIGCFMGSAFVSHPIDDLGSYIWSIHLVSSFTELIQISLLFMPLPENPGCIAHWMNKYLEYGAWCEEKRKAQEELERRRNGEEVKKTSALLDLAAGASAAASAATASVSATGASIAMGAMERMNEAKAKVSAVAGNHLNTQWQRGISPNPNPSSNGPSSNSNSIDAAENL